jgi:hypothetical protein
MESGFWAVNKKNSNFLQVQNKASFGGLEANTSYGGQQSQLSEPAGTGDTEYSICYISFFGLEVAHNLGGVSVHLPLFTCLSHPSKWSRYKWTQDGTK